VCVQVLACACMRVKERERERERDKERERERVCERESIYVHYAGSRQEGDTSGLRRGHEVTSSMMVLK